MISSSSLTTLLTPILAFAVAAGSAPLARAVAIRYGVVASPAPDSRHPEPKPAGGGLSIISGMLLSLAITGNLPLWIALSALALLVAGLVDDAIVLSPRQKLWAELIVASAVLLLAPGPGFRLAPWPAVEFAIALLWLIGTSNAFNLIDGLDGLASGIGMAAAAAIVATALLHHNLVLAGWGLALGGALAGFLVYNFYPASIIMGDGGALPVGMLLGIFALRAGALANNSRLTPYVFPVLVMLVPLLDTAIVSVTRLATGRSISRRGLDHSHHRLLSLGVSDPRAVFSFWGVASISAACAVGATVLPHAYLLSTLPLVMLAAALVGLFMMDLTFDSREPGIAYGYLPRIARFILSMSYKWRLVEVALDVVVISAAYFSAFLIRLDFKISDEQVSALVASLPWVLMATYPALFVAGAYRGMWRYVGLADVIRFAQSAVLAGILLVALSLVAPVSISGSVSVLFVILLFNLLVASRMSFRVLRSAIARLTAPGNRVLIIGAGRTGVAAARGIVSQSDRNVRLVGFVDDDAFKQGKLVHGHPVLGSLEDLARIQSETSFNQILIAADSLDEERLAIVQSFANQWHLGIRRFLIEMNEMTLSANGSLPEIPAGEPGPSKMRINV
ncbi:MAG: hypothetical protein WA005_15150 [Candidatus Binataceae bacterium]